MRLSGAKLKDIQLSARSCRRKTGNARMRCLSDHIYEAYDAAKTASVREAKRLRAFAAKLEREAGGIYGHRDDDRREPYAIVR